MYRFKILTLAAVTTGIVMLAPQVQANDKHGYTPHHLVAYKDYLRYLTPEQKVELHNYLNYEFREPCQNYKKVPDGFIREGCDLKYVYPKKMAAKPVQEAKPVRESTVITNVLNSYEINFAFDSAEIDSPAVATLDKIASDIKRYKPREVVVAGHADTAGPADYNVELSERRADAVSRSLTARNIPNRILDKEAHGETHPAVDTADGVPLRENRRVVVEFRK
ncbi:MAG: OmpA family protein [Alphaproteobacteria bacterium]|nr:OmpA family protein [Alphaproteobacteria bacterium]